MDPELALLILGLALVVLAYFTKETNAIIGALLACIAGISGRSRKPPKPKPPAKA